MRNQERKKELSFKKFQIAKISNPKFIMGGTDFNDDDDDPRTTDTMGQNGND